ncbi:InlB B-repeat-containing protein [Thiorhodovibrio litoralis]|uniref:InlB B-repeat-containing protein n=2 Tax=Thiorhodovibrio TaxID=61593 RepID=UPI002B260F6C|nr:choice-of-anchor U domain-containing protein [Thiorhodovibrio litoralis]
MSLFFLFWENAAASQFNWGTPPTDLSATGQNAVDPQVAVDSSGNAIAVWERSGIIQSARYQVGTGWVKADGAIEVSNLSDPSLNAYVPQVAIDSSGNAIAVWERNSIIQSARYQVGTGWVKADGAIEVSDLSATGQNADNPQVAVDNSGNAIAVWEVFNGNWIIQSARYVADSETWGAISDLSATGLNAYDPQVAVDSSGNAIAVWKRKFIIQSSRYDADRGTWGEVSDLSDLGATGWADVPQVAVNSSGKAIAVWRGYDGSNRIIQSLRYDADSGTWGEVSNLTELGGEEPQVAIDNSGNAIAVWRGSNGSNQIIQSARYEEGTGWVKDGEAIEVSDLSATGQSADVPQIAMDSSGNAIAVWRRLSSPAIIQSSRYDAVSEAWSAVSDLGAAATSVRHQIAVDSSGNATAVWAASNGSNLIIRSARGIPTYSIGGTVSGLASDQSVALQNNAGDDKTVSANGAFTFDTNIASGESYAVTVLTQPTGQTCTVSNDSGSNVMADVSNVSVTCATNTHAISTNPGAGGSISCTPNPVPEGEDSECTATPNSGYSFSSWGGACSGSTNPCTLSNVTEAKTVSATFESTGGGGGGGGGGTPSPINGRCGSAEGEAFAVAPSSNLCSAGTPSAVSGTGPWSWTCQGQYGGTDANCTATTAEVDGRCGSASGATFATRPSSGLCASGTAGAIAGTGPWFWNCSGQHGGASTWCGANAAGLPPYDPDPDIPSDEIWTQLPDEDTDGIPDAVEGQVLSLDGATQGDGNGDGIPDVEQAHVSAFTGADCPERERPRFVTLAAPVGTELSDVTRREPPDDLPEDLTLGCGEIAFQVQGLEPGATLDFSVYVENDAAVNGYYYRNRQTGAWDNIATAITPEGIKIRLDYQLQDGGPYDADGLTNGTLVDPGGPGYRGEMASLLLPVNNGISLYERLYVYGQQGQEWVRLEGGRGSWIDQNIDGIELPGALSDYRFSQAGNTVWIEGPNRSARIVVQGGAHGTAVATDEGGTWLHFSGQQVLLGHQPLSSRAQQFDASELGDSFDPAAAAGTGPFSDNLSPNRFLLEPNAVVHLAELADAYGTPARDTLRLVGTPGVEVDQNIDRVHLDGALGDYRFRQQGNGAEITRNDRWVATIRAQGDADGTELLFTDVSAPLWYDGNQMRLGRAALASERAGIIEQDAL